MQTKHTFFQGSFVPQDIIVGRRRVNERKLITLKGVGTKQQKQCLLMTKRTVMGCMNDHDDYIKC